MVLLQRKQEDDRMRLEQMFKERLKEHKEQMDNMLQANSRELQLEREAALARQETMEEMLELLKETVEKKDNQIDDIREDIRQKQESMEKVVSELMQTLQTKEGAIGSLETKITQLENASENEIKVMQEKATDLERTLATRQDELQMLKNKMDEQDEAGLASQQQMYSFFQESMEAKQEEIDQLVGNINAVNQEAANSRSEMQQEIKRLRSQRICVIS